MTGARTEGGEPTDVSRQAGRGGLAVAAAKAYFILAGLVQQFALPRVLGLDGYGALSSVQSIASIAYNPIVGTSIQGVSRAVAGAPRGREQIVLRRVLSLHAVIALCLAGAFFAAAPAIGTLVGVPHLVPALRILSLVLLCYGCYAPLVGGLNGARRFVAQAGFDVLAATLRTVGLVGGAYLFVHPGNRVAGVEGAAWGFVASATLVLVGALFVVGIGRRGSGTDPVRHHLVFVGRLFVGQTLLNLLLQADLTLLRRFGAEAARREGLPESAADLLVGTYRATQLFSFLPYQLLVAVTFVLFPMLASARRDADHAGVARYVENGLRLSLIITGGMVSVTSGLAAPLLRLVFGAQAADHGAPTLEILSLGFGAFAMFGLLSAILNGLGRERESARVTAFAFALVVGACFASVRGAPLSDDLLVRTALSTSAGIVVAMLTASVLVFRTARALVRPLTLVRVAAAVAVAAALGRLLPSLRGPLVIAAALGVGLTYVAMLAVTRELQASDVLLVRSVLKRRG